MGKDLLQKNLYTTNLVWDLQGVNTGKWISNSRSFMFLNELINVWTNNVTLA